MSRRVHTARDVLAAADRGADRLVVAADDLLTPLARDEARARGVRILTAARAPDSTESDGVLEQRVRRILAAVLADAADENAVGTPAANGAGRRVRRVDGRDVAMSRFPFDVAPPEMDVRTADVITSAGGFPMCAGFMSLREGSFPWSFSYDEVEFVLEGELHIGYEGQTIVGRPGDVLAVSKGANISFGTPSWAKFLYVTYPADWSGSVPPDGEVKA